VSVGLAGLFTFKLLHKSATEKRRSFLRQE
jgi:hypothetical protein